MSRNLNWLPLRSKQALPDDDVPFVQETPDVVHVLIIQLARGAWSTLARLLQLTCLTLDIKPLLAHELANAGVTGVVLDVLCQAPRHHPAWRALSTAGAGLLAALVRCDGGTEAAQPQALRLLLSMLESGLTCGAARQAVATVLHSVVAQRTVHRDKLLAAGALPVLLRVLRRLDVLCDVIAVQELLWTLAYLTDEDALAMAGGGGASCVPYHPAVAERLAPLLFLYGMPWHPQHGHLAALATRVLHVQVAAHDVGKDTLRASGVPAVLVDLVRRHSEPYRLAATAVQQRHGPGYATGSGLQPGSSRGLPGAAGVARVSPSSSTSAAALGAAAAAGWHVGPTRPPPHLQCDVHTELAADLRGQLPSGTTGAEAAVRKGPYGTDPAVALGPWTPWRRLLAVLLILGVVPELSSAQRKRRSTAHRAVAAAGGAVSGGGAAAAGANGDDMETPSPLASDLEEDDDDEAEAGGGGGGGGSGMEGGGEPGKKLGTSGTGAVAAKVEEDEEEDDVFGNAAEITPAFSEAANGSPVAAAAAATAGTAASDPRVSPIVEGARLACYGLLLPLLVDADGTAPSNGSGGGDTTTSAAASAASGVLLRRRLCPLREALATLKTLLCDCEANQQEVSEQGLVPLLVQLLAHGDMGLAWQSAEVAVQLAGGQPGAQLLAAGAVEELALLLQESADALHGLTLRKQIQVQIQQVQNATASGSSSSSGGHHHKQQQHQQRQLHAPKDQPFQKLGTLKKEPSHPPAPQQQHRGPPTSSGGALAAAAMPAPLPSVHVRPNPNPYAASRPQRLYLLGRVPLDFTTSSSCFYGSHGAASYCDYCTPSVAVKALLRLMSATAPALPPLAAAPDGGAAGAVAAPEVAVCVRFAAVGGLYGLLQLLHHEAAGVHHSKLAASLLTLLDLVLVHAPGAQDEFRTAGGLGVLVSLLGSLMRPGVMDVYQLRVATCRTLRLALQGNAANKLASREHGLLPLLTAQLTVLAERRKARSGEVVLDDDGPLTGATLEALHAAAKGSRGSQEALVALGLLHPVCALVRDEHLDTDIRTTAVRTLTAVVDEHLAGQNGALALGVVPVVVGWLEHCCCSGTGVAAGGGGSLIGSFSASRRASGGGSGGGAGGGGRTALHPAQAETTLAAAAVEPVRAVTSLLAALVRGNNAQAKAALVAAGALPLLVQLLRAPADPPAAAAAGATNAPIAAAAAAATAPAETAAELAAGLLATLAEGDTDIQNELVSQGALTAAADVVRGGGGGGAAAAALRLLTVMLHANTFVKNTARHSGLPATLVAAVRRCGLACSGGAAAAAAALTELAAGNHANQDEVAMQGGLEVAVELARDAFAALPLGPLGGSGGGGAAAAVAEPSQDLTGGAIGGDVGSGKGVTVRQAADAAAADLEASAALSRLLHALFGLLGACVELNAGNKEYVRELGGVALLGDFLLTTAELLTAAPRLGRQPPQQQQLQERLQPWEHGAGGGQGRERDAAAVAAARTAVLPAVAAACGAVAALVRESAANLARLEEQPYLPLALLKLLVASDAVTSNAAARAVEWIVIRSAVHFQAPSREAFELHLVDLLVLALYVPYGPVPVAPYAESSLASSSGLGGMPQQFRDPHQGPWHVTVTSLMPSEGVTAAAVRDAAAVLTAVADAADSLDAVQAKQQQQQAQQLQRLQGQQRGSDSKVSTTTHGSLPRLDPLPSGGALAADHASGLVLSSSLSGPLAGAAAAAAAAAPGSPARWAALAGSAAAAFQKVANGVLLQGPMLPGQAAATAGGGMGGGVAGAATASGGSAGQGSLASGRGMMGSVGGGGATTVAAAQERRRQVAWMLFLLAARSQENRARVRRLVRASLTPLAQQLANAEACRAQLEAAAAAAAAADGGAGGASMPPALSPMSSAALESVSSVSGRLPVSTSALEALSTMSLPAAHASTPSVPPQPPQPPYHQQQHLQQPPSHQIERQLGQQQQEGSAPQEQEQQQQQWQQQGPTPGRLPLHAAASSASRTPAALPTQPYGAAPSSAIGAFPGAATAGYGALYGTPPASLPPTPPTSIPPTPREPTFGGAAVPPAAAAASSSFAATTVGMAGMLRSPTVPEGSSSALLRVSSLDPSASAALRSGRHSRNASGGAGGGITLTPRLSLSGAVAAAFAPTALHPSFGNIITPAGLGTARGSGSGMGPGPSLLGPGNGGGIAAEAVGAVEAGMLLSPPQQQQRALHAQVGGGGSSCLSDDDELAMIQQEVALLATTTRTLAWGGGAGATSAPGSGQPSARTDSSPAASPARWGYGRR